METQESKMTLGFQLGSTEVLGVYMGGLRKREKERKAWWGWETKNPAVEDLRPELFSQPPRNRSFPALQAVRRVQEEMKCLQTQHVTKPAHHNLKMAVREWKI